MMSDSIFTIRNLRCGYNKSKEVLNISHLDIYSGQLTFVIGKSGSGKSTLLETLGFMNDTFFDEAHGSIAYHAPDGMVSDIYNQWQLKLEEQASFRNLNFSFIFQENNLLEHFTALENILVPLMMAGKNAATSKADIESAFEDIHLPIEVMNKNTRHLSGGQRQRVSFLRALLPAKPVLFGDEPTGNLDPVTARALFTMIKKEVTTKGSSAIIVSHDLPLARLYADRIIVLKANDQTQIGSVDSIFIMKDNQWLEEKNNKPIDTEQLISMI